MDKKIKKIADWIRAENIRSKNLQIVLDEFTGSNHVSDFYIKLL